MRLFTLGIVIAGVSLGLSAQEAPSSTSGSPTHSTDSENRTQSADSKPRVERIGHGVTPPALLHSEEPQFSDEARRKKIGGTVTVALQVDPQGMPTQIRVVRGLGHGLDEKAVEAVKLYRFRPAMKDGKPVTVEINVAINFQIFDGNYRP